MLIWPGLKQQWMTAQGTYGVANEGCERSSVLHVRAKNSVFEYSERKHFTKLEISGMNCFDLTEKCSAPLSTTPHRSRNVDYYVRVVILWYKEKYQWNLISMLKRRKKGIFSLYNWMFYYPGAIKFMEMKESRMPHAAYCREK